MRGDLKTMGDRTKIYVSVDDARECDALTESQIAKRRMQVTTEQNLVMMDADEAVACLKLRGMHTPEGVMTDRVVFRDIFGSRHNWKRESTDGRAAHFALWPGEGGSGGGSSPAVSAAHELSLIHI